MANTHGESSMEEFAAKALPELEDLLERFKDQNKSADEPEPEPEPVKHDDAGDGNERVKELAHIIWHLAGQIEDIAYHGDKDNVWVISRSQDLRRQLVYIKGYLHGELHGENSEVGNF